MIGGEARTLTGAAHNDAMITKYIGASFDRDRTEFDDEVTVSFYDGTVLKGTQTVIRGSTVTDPGPTPPAGKAFGGWYTGTAFTTEWTFADPVNDDMDLFVKWVDDGDGTGGGDGGNGGGNTLPFIPIAVIAVTAALAVVCVFFIRRK